MRDILRDDEQVVAVLDVLRHADADILVLAGLDYDLHAVALQLLAERLDDYPFRFQGPPNRGLLLTQDRDKDGRLGEPEDAEGYAEFVGQGAMAILSRLPILEDQIRDFSAFRWKDLPNHIALSDGKDPERLSTTSHWDVPIALAEDRTVHLLTWHATAPVFDGPNDRNGRRNHDEAAFWAAYLAGELPQAPPQNFLLLGVANADPFDGDSRSEGIRALLNHKELQDPRPTSVGATRAASRDGGVNETHQGPPSLDTVDWPDGLRDPGNLRVDYILPARMLEVVGSGVLWPDENDPISPQVAQASRHRLVWLDIAIEGSKP